MSLRNENVNLLPGKQVVPGHLQWPFSWCTDASDQDQHQIAMDMCLVQDLSDMHHLQENLLRDSLWKGRLALQDL